MKAALLTLLISTPVMAQELRFFSAFCKNEATLATFRVESSVKGPDLGTYVMNTELVKTFYGELQTSINSYSVGHIYYKGNAYRFSTNDRYLAVVLETQAEGTLLTYEKEGEKKVYFYFNKNECDFFDGKDQSFTH